MSVSLREYSIWLDERKLLWPAPPARITPKATPAIHPLRNIRAVVWNVYGTLLSISDGEFLFEPKPPIRLQVALEKTIQEFNMWNSMTRHPGEPWEYLLPKYQNAISDQRMISPARKGDLPEVNSAHTWIKLLELLKHKDYQYDIDFYGDLDEYSEKIAYFFHRALQGCIAAPNASVAVIAVADAGLTQGLLADAQPFTFTQLLRALEEQSKLPTAARLFTSNCQFLSYRFGVRKPSASLYIQAAHAMEQAGLTPREVLYIGTRVADDLAAARKVGFRTALYAGDKLSLAATSADVKNPESRPDRLLTDLAQLRDVLMI